MKPRLLRIVSLWCEVNNSIIYAAFMHGVGIFKYVYSPTLDTLSNYYDSVYMPYDRKIPYFIFLKYMIQY